MGKKGFDLAALAKAAMGDGAPVSELDRVELLPAAEISVNGANFYEMSDLEELASSIELVGQLQPVLVKPRPEGGYTLVDGERRYRAVTEVLGRSEIACLVRTPVSDVLEELMLIEANRTQRKMSAADLSRQAERYTELLAALKESGVEIPGRLRDRVAEALQVSSSKLARLHAIRKNLEPGLLALFDDGDLNESAAYELSRFDHQKQLRVFDFLTPLNTEDFPGTVTAEAVRVAGAEDDRDRDLDRAPDYVDQKTKQGEDDDFSLLLNEAAAPFLRTLAGVDSRKEGIALLKERYGRCYNGSGSWNLSWDAEPAGLRIESSERKIRKIFRPWAFVYDMLCAIALNRVNAPQGVSKSDTPPGLDWHDRRDDGPPPEEAAAVMFWTPDHGYVFPPRHLIREYLKTLPEMTTWWTVIQPPKEETVGL